MDYIIVRHVILNDPDARRRLVFLDATLVTNAESDGDALRAVGEKLPTERKIGSWEIIPVTPDRTIDAST